MIFAIDNSFLQLGDYKNNWWTRDLKEWVLYLPESKIPYWDYEKEKMVNRCGTDFSFLENDRENASILINGSKCWSVIKTKMESGMIHLTFKKVLAGTGEENSIEFELSCPKSNANIGMLENQANFIAECNDENYVSRYYELDSKTNSVTPLNNPLFTQTIYKAGEPRKSWELPYYTSGYLLDRFGKAWSDWRLDTSVFYLDFSDKVQW